MRSETVLQLALAAALIAAGVGLSACNQDSRPKGWSEQWYRKGQTPEEAAEWRRKHPDRGRRTDDASRAATPIGSY